jgi:hypothetical protein
MGPAADVAMDSNHEDREPVRAHRRRHTLRPSPLPGREPVNGVAVRDQEVEGFERRVPGEPIRRSDVDSRTRRSWSSWFSERNTMPGRRRAGAPRGRRWSTRRVFAPPWQRVDRR